MLRAPVEPRVRPEPAGLRAPALPGPAEPQGLQVLPVPLVLRVPVRPEPAGLLEPVQVPRSVSTPESTR